MDRPKQPSDDPPSPRKAIDRRTLLTSTTAAAIAAGLANDASEAVAQQAQRPANNRILIKNGVVLSFDPGVGDFARADVLIEGGRIAAVRPDIAAEATVFEAGNMIVMPGFIDTHHHFYQSALRNSLGNGLLADYFRDIVNAATPLYRAEDAHIGVLSGAIRSLDAGVTTVTDLSQVSNSPEHSDAMVHAFKESGIRAIYAYQRGYGPKAQYPQDVVRIQNQHFSSSDQLVTLALATAVDRDQILLGRHQGLRIFTHVVGGNRGVEPNDVEKLALWGPDNVYIHFTGATPAQMQKVKDSGGWLSIACPIEMTMRHGMPVIQMALDHGIRPSLSSDVETTMAADMFTQLRSVFTLQRAFLNQRSIEGEKDLPPLLTAREILALATIEGARADGLESKTGSLMPGKAADIILLRADLPNVMPLNNAYGAIVTNMDTSNVDTVFVGGRMRKHRGRLLGVDLASLNKRVAASRDYLYAQLKWPRSPVDTSLPGH